MKHLATLLILTFPSLAMAEAVAWNVVQDDTHLTFTTTEEGKKVKHTIEKFDADITFSKDDLENSRVAITIPVSEITRPDYDVIETLRAADFFDADTHPNAVYEAEEFVFVDNNEYLAKGHLTLKGTRLPFDLPFTLDINDDRAHMQADFQVLRLPYNIGIGSWRDTSFIADGVDVDIDLTARRTSVQ